MDFEGFKAPVPKKNENRPNASALWAAALIWYKQVIIFTQTCMYEAFFCPLFAIKAPDPLCFSQMSQRMKIKRQKTAGREKVVGALIYQSRLRPITASGYQELHLDLPWPATRSTVISVNSSINCTAGCLKRVLFWSHKGNVAINKWRWTLRQQALLVHGSSYGCAGTAASVVHAEKIPDPGGSLPKLPAHHRLETHYFRNVFILSDCEHLGSLVERTAAADIVLWQSELSLSPPSPWDCADCAYKPELDDVSLLDSWGRKWEHKVLANDKVSLPLSYSGCFMLDNHIWLDS